MNDLPWQPQRGPATYPPDGALNVVSQPYTSLSATRNFRHATAAHDAALRSGANPLIGWDRNAWQRGIAQGVPPIMIVTLPKSGSTYIANAISQALAIPYIQVTLSRWPDDYLLPEALKLFSKGGAVSQSHLDPKRENLDMLAAAGIHRLHIHVRDPRQATVSWAHFIAARPPEAHHLGYLSDPVPPADFSAWPEADRMEWWASHHYPQCLSWIAQWLQVARHDRRFSITFSDHSRLSGDRLMFLRDLMTAFRCGHATVTDESAPPPVPGVAHFRSGLAEEWRTAMPVAAQRLMNDLLPPKLARHFGWPLD